MAHKSIDRRPSAANRTFPTTSLSFPTLTILYDNTVYDPRLRSAWGFSCLVEWDGKSLMFDTGGEGRRLVSHMEIMDKDPGQIDMVFLSHIHGDHTGGLEELSVHNPRLEIYIPQSFPPGFDEAAERRGPRPVRISSPREISPGLFSTGEMGVWTKEQSLVMDVKGGAIVLTGCAHPGIVEVIKRAKAMVPGGIRLVMGGYHLFSAHQREIIEVIEAFQEIGVEEVCPCHCTGEMAITLFRESYGKGYIAGGAGRVVGIV